VTQHIKRWLRGSYRGGGSFSGADKLHKLGAYIGNHSGSIAVTPENLCCFNQSAVKFETQKTIYFYLASKFLKFQTTLGRSPIEV